MLLVKINQNNTDKVSSAVLNNRVPLGFRNYRSSFERTCHLSQKSSICCKKL